MKNMMKNLDPRPYAISGILALFALIGYGLYQEREVTIQKGDAYLRFGKPNHVDRMLPNDSE